MIRKAEERTLQQKINVRGGPGIADFIHLANQDELYDKSRLFSHIVLRPGCGFGYHLHENEEEIYYMLKGTADYDDNGVKTKVSAGDVTFTFDGQGHSITNNSDETVEFIALIIFK